MEKYVVDTSVLLADPGILNKPNTEIIIPGVVIKELNDQKKRMDEVGHNARSVSNFLDGLRDRGNLRDGAKLENDSIIRISYSDIMIDNNDLKIIEAAKKENAVLLSRDTNVRIASDVYGVIAEDYNADSISDVDDLYKGWKEIRYPKEKIDQFYSEKKLKTGYRLYPNEFVIIKEDNGSGQSAIARYDAEAKALVPLRYANEKLLGIGALNVEQKFAIELLLNDNIKLVSFNGKSGSGKTLLTLAAGLQKTIHEDKYRKLLICRSTIPVGGHFNEIGFLPGDLDEKMLPWMRCIYDNLEFLFDSSNIFEKDGKRLEVSIMDQLPPGKIEIQPMTFIRGRSLPGIWIILEEGQNTTPKEMKALISRAGKGTKVIIIGDCSQIDHPYLDRYNNGLMYLTERMKGQKIFGHVTLTKTERSELADLASELL